MKEAAFLKRNAEKWRAFESDLKGRAQLDPDRLLRIHDELSDDLSYVRTFFPDERSEAYLNGLAALAHYRIHRNKKERGGRILGFWARELPMVLGKARKELILSFSIFLISVLIGILSQAYQPSFAGIMLGDAYVERTISNIEKGEPMAIYKQGTAMNAFMGITLNNLKVAMLTFVLGVFFSVGTVYILLQNGIMLGAFFCLFHQHGETFDAMTTVWMHGTLEIICIILAGTAGLVMGNSFLFPGSYPRKNSFMRGSKKGLKIAMGTVPFFVLAGFIEGFLTRMTSMAPFFKLLIILGSLFFALYYFLLLPQDQAKADDGKG